MSPCTATIEAAAQAVATQPWAKLHSYTATCAIVRDETTGGHRHSPSTIWEVYRGEKLAGVTHRLWIAQAVAAALDAGHISPKGDTVRALTSWARENDPALHDRLAFDR